MLSSENAAIKLNCQWTNFSFQETTSPFHLQRKLFWTKRAFDEAIYKNAGDEANELFHSKNSCTYQDLRIGEYCFREAIKVDLAESEDKLQKNQTRVQKIKTLF